MAFVRGTIETAFRLAGESDRGASSFSQSGFLGNTVNVKGLRTSAKIVKAGTLAMTASLRIYGMNISVMNDLSSLGLKVGQLEFNAMSISVGDGKGGSGLVFIGDVIGAWIDFDGMPEVAFDVSAQVGAADAIISAEPSSFTGPTDIATIMNGFAVKMNLPFENNGVIGTLASPYFPGTLWEQTQACARHGGFRVARDVGKLIIWPEGGARGGLIPVVSPETGLVRYPTYTEVGLILRTVYNPSISFGSKIKVESSLPPADGIWLVESINHDLDYLVPNGQWHSTIAASSVNLPRPVPR